MRSALLTLLIENSKEIPSDTVRRGGRERRREGAGGVIKRWKEDKEVRGGRGVRKTISKKF